eukprot:1055722-Karenia_brevis.AAC.1
MAIDEMDKEDAALHAELLRDVPDDDEEFLTAADGVGSQASTMARSEKTVKGETNSGALDADKFDPWAQAAATPEGRARAGMVGMSNNGINGEPGMPMGGLVTGKSLDGMTHRITQPHQYVNRSHHPHTKGQPNNSKPRLIEVLELLQAMKGHQLE